MLGINIYNQETMARLWAEHETAICKAAYSYMANHTITGGHTVDDLIAEGYTGLIDAVETYDDSYGVPLAAWIIIKCKGVWGRMTRSNDALDRPGTISLDAPVNYADAGNTETIVGDLTPDPRAEYTEQVLNALLYTEYAKVIKTAIASMPPEIAACVQARYMDGKQIAEIKIPGAANKIQQGLKLLRTELKKHGLYKGGEYYVGM